MMTIIHRRPEENAAGDCSLLNCGCLYPLGVVEQSSGCDKGYFCPKLSKASEGREDCGVLLGW